MIVVILRRGMAANRQLLDNSISVLTSAWTTAALGAAYWWLAARTFTPAAVGFASAAISAMTLIGNVGMLGLGTFLIGELPKQPGKRGSLTASSLIVSGVASAILGSAFAWLAPRLSPGLSQLGETAGQVALFSVGAALTGLTLVVDDALVGLFRGQLQFWRNAAFSVIKLLLLLVVAHALIARDGMSIYGTWAVGNLLSLLVLLNLFLAPPAQMGDWRPRPGFLRTVGGAALGHHALNLVLRAPGLIMPIIVSVELSTEANAGFYMASMIASMVAYVATAFTTVLYAVGSADPSTLARKIRFTLRLSGIAAVLGTLFVLISGRFILGLFGVTYAGQGTVALWILTFSALPGLIRSHYIALCRIQGRIVRTALVMTGASLLEIGAGALGAVWGGLNGLSIGWLAGMCLEALLMARPVYQAARVTEPEIGVDPAGLDSSVRGSEERMGAAS